MRKIQVYLVMALMILLNGCGFMGIDFTQNRTIAIQKSPYVIVTDGDLTRSDLKSVDRILAMLSTQPYQDANNTNFRVHVTDQTTVMKSDTITNEVKNTREIEE